MEEEPEIRKWIDFTEHQTQALNYLEIAVNRCKLEGLSRNIIIQMVKSFLGERVT